MKRAHFVGRYNVNSFVQQILNCALALERKMVCLYDVTCFQGICHLVGKRGMCTTHGDHRADKMRVVSE